MHDVNDFLGIKDRKTAFRQELVTLEAHKRSQIVIFRAQKLSSAAFRRFTLTTK